ncbi:hypothetical protein [Thalassovita mangrovi]|uniref:Uncharacterized protein n=1 Tax=Thalassovita mangrovi TaxID=2692236 RepID=A0A6L8LNG2_9RHOB|nr:hypothetical protein [Thalassovita mangrovi]MYM57103.1 hypothetical protein [Thalassovita mangrovi]
MEKIQKFVALGFTVAFTVLAVVSAAGHATASETRSACKQVEADGKRMYLTSSLTLNDNHTGCVEGRNVIDFMTEEAALTYTNELRAAEQTSSLMLCTIIGTGVSVSSPVLGPIAGFVCSRIAFDTREQLRAGDRVVELVSSCSFGGGGGMETLNIKVALRMTDAGPRLVYLAAPLGKLPDKDVLEKIIAEEMEKFAAKDSAPETCAEDTGKPAPAGQEEAQKAALLDGRYSWEAEFYNKDAEERHVETCEASVGGTTVHVSYTYKSDKYLHTRLDLTLTGHYWPEDANDMHSEVASNKAHVNFELGEISGTWTLFRDGWGNEEKKVEDVKGTDDRYWFFRTQDGGKTYALRWAASRFSGDTFSGDASGDCLFDPDNPGRDGAIGHKVTIARTSNP